MNKNVIPISLFFIIIALSFLSFQIINEDKILSHIVDLKKQNLEFYWKNEKNENLSNFDKLKQWLDKKSERLIFATNGGMYLKDRSPQGLFIQNGILKKKIDTIQEGYGNFYLQPNGVFSVTNKNEGIICPSIDFSNQDVKFATQSGPMLLIDGKIHSKFREGSKNLNIRNGVGILPDGRLIFGMSKQEINFFDFASYFKSLGCKNALYLDGFVSRTYLPSKDWVSIDGSFGVIIAETEKK